MEFAKKAHEGQLRKGTSIPYIVHPMEVGDIVLQLTDDEDVICAAYLHDTIEDCEDVTRELLEEVFGKRIADIVDQESEDKSQTWLVRKQTTIRRLNEASWEVQIVALGDKLSNMRDIARDYPVEGEEFWKRFSMGDKGVIGWYYKGVRDSLRESMGDTPQYEEYCRLIRENF